MFTAQLETKKQNKNSYQAMVEYISLMDVFKNFNY